MIITVAFYCPNPARVFLCIDHPKKKYSKHLMRQIGQKGDLVVGLQKVEIPIPFGMKKLRIKAMDMQTNKPLYCKVISKKRTKKIPLRTTNQVSKFIEFAKVFATHSGTYKNRKYKDKTGEFTINLVNQIIENGKIVPTIARVDHYTGQIDIVAPKWKTLTIYNRFMILCHEFYHYYKNTTSEFDCDYFAYIIAKQLGISQTERLYSLIRVFNSIKEGSEKEARIFTMHDLILQEINQNHNHVN